MADVKIRFTVPGDMIPAIHAAMEADDTPPCELHIKKTSAPRVLQDIVTDGRPGAGVRDIEITTDEADAGYFRNMMLGGHDK
jgi:hypothetical protein